MESASRFFGKSILAAGMLVTSASFLNAATTCAVRSSHELNEGEKALLAADYAKAERWFRGAISGQPGDDQLTVGLVHSLLRQQKVKEADDAIEGALKASPESAVLISVRGEVELREGFPWLAAGSAKEVLRRDPCLARNDLLLARLDSLSSLHASSLKAITMAHQLDPTDPEIRRQWLFTLPLKERLAEAEAYGASANGSDADEAREWKEYVDRLRKEAGEPHRRCRLVSAVESTQIPLTHVFVGFDPNRIGLPVKLNNKSSLLQVDTGASGILISRRVAERAGLKALSATDVGGVGDTGDKAAYTALVDNIRIGDLEFRDCEVTVEDSRYVAHDLDGLIGMDVLSHFLVTLDFPARKLLLGPLPKRPDEPAGAPSLKTDEADPEDVESSAQSATGEVAKADVNATGATQAATIPAARPVRRGPFDRYIAPEMKDYVPVYRIGHNLLIPTGLNGGHPKLFILDTGAWATSISPAAAREVTNVQRDYTQRVTGLSGEIASVYKANQVTFSFAYLSQKVEGVPSFDTSRLSKDLGVEVSGFLGASTLNLLTVQIDYRDGLVRCVYDEKRLWR